MCKEEHKDKSKGKLGSSFSLRKFKHNISQLPDALGHVMDVKSEVYGIKGINSLPET